MGEEVTLFLFGYKPLQFSEAVHLSLSQHYE